MTGQFFFSFHFGWLKFLTHCQISPDVITA
jgi:hypothetical protein